MKNALVILALGSLLLAPIEAAQPQPSNICTGKPAPRKTFKRFLSWLGLGIGSTCVASILIGNNQSLRYETRQLNKQLTDLDQKLRNLPTEEAISRSTVSDRERDRIHAEKDTFTLIRQDVSNVLETTKYRQSLNKAALASAYIAIIASLFKAYKNLPDKKARFAAEHFCKAMGYGLSGLGMGIASAGALGLGGLHALNIGDLRQPTTAFSGVATAAIAWHYLLPITWNLSKQHWQTAKEEWSKFRNPEQNNVQPSAPASTPAAA